MVRVSIVYPGGPGKQFNWDYYLEKHIKGGVESAKSLGLVRWEVDKGLGTVQPGAPAPYVCMAHMYFNNLADFQKCMAVAGSALTADIPNFTDIQPQIQISEIIDK